MDIEPALEIAEEYRRDLVYETGRTATAEALVLLADLYLAATRTKTARP